MHINTLFNLMGRVMSIEKMTINGKERDVIKPTHEAADAFWKYWEENGETHKHGYYESTWGAINAALNADIGEGVL